LSYFKSLAISLPGLSSAGGATRNIGRIPRNHSTKENRGIEAFSIPRALVARGGFEPPTFGL
jgi:hypothetical protein